MVNSQDKVPSTAVNSSIDVNLEKITSNNMTQSLSSSSFVDNVAMNVVIYYTTPLPSSSNSSVTEHSVKNTTVSSDNTSSTSSTSSFRCAECGKCYARYRIMRAHVLRHHPENSEKVPPLRDIKSFKFQCNNCSRRFNDVKNYRHHTRKCGQNKNCYIIPQPKYLKKCSECGNDFVKEKDIRQHFETEHQIKLETVCLEFDSYNTFNNWKAEEEKSTKSKYVKQCAALRTKKKTVHYFKCHRSGHFVSKSKGIRNLKVQGSNKSGFFCPSYMRVSIIDDEECKVTYIKTHVGHKNDLIHIPLSKEERESIAVKIASKIPFDVILDEIRNSISGNIERIHLLSKKDLENIERSYHLESEAVKHDDDTISVDSWINELKKCDCVLFYKPQGIEYCDFKDDDFILIIMNAAQQELLRIYGSDCICIDGTYGTNSNGFELTTLMVIDDMRQGFPCAFMFSNRVDSMVLNLFFSQISEVVGKIKTQVFMSDVANIYFESWVQIMQPPENRLFCTWHVDRAWRKNLSKIKSKEKRIELYKNLRMLLQEADKSTFQALIEHFINNTLEDEETKAFGLYFVEHYYKSVDTWAHCYRLNSGISTNIHVERMHQTLKHLYLRGKCSKRLDKSIGAIMKFIRDKLIDRLVILKKGEVTYKLRAIRGRHVKSMSLSEEIISETDQGYSVAPPDTTDVYFVSKLNEKCDCKLMCKDCNTCIHQFSCTCLDYSIKWNMCKHIHLICRTRNSSTQDPKCTSAIEVKNENNFIINTKNNDALEAIIAELSNVKYVGSLDERRRNLIRKFSEAANNAKSSEEIELLENIVEDMQQRLKVMQASNC